MMTVRQEAPTHSGRGPEWEPGAPTHSGRGPEWEPGAPTHSGRGPEWEPGAGGRRQEDAAVKPVAKGSAGFTLVEVLVATAIFVLLFSVTIGTYIFHVKQQTTGALTGAMLGEVQNFFETLEREVRTGFGSTFNATGACAAGSGSMSFEFRNQDRDLVTYSLNATNRLQRKKNAGSNEFLTSPSLQVKDLCFQATAAGVDPGLPAPILTGSQGRVTVNIRVCPSGVDDARCARVQTTLTSRQHAPY